MPQLVSRPRLGLCCLFREEPIRFRTATATVMQRRQASGADVAALLAAILLDNLDALAAAIIYCHTHSIGSFRISSQLFPLATHPVLHYCWADLPEALAIDDKLAACRQLARNYHIRLTFHPDQFVVLNSPRPQVIEASLQDLEHHALLAEALGVDAVNIHAGGVYGDKTAALQRLEKALGRLSQRALALLTLENDDKSYSPADLLPFCRMHGIPLVYDVHHHRCLPDGLSIESATEDAIRTWNREPLFHISSPQQGWMGKNKKYHHDLIDLSDFPSCWYNLSPLTIEVEAKAKEIAVLKLLAELQDVGFQWKKNIC